MIQTFTRTPTGIAGKWQFYKVPTIWVEGPTDIFFYTPIVDDLQCRIEAFHGYHNATALIEGLKKYDFPYIVILDGDYTMLERRRAPHRRIIHLKKYAFENYLWESGPLNRACHRCAQSGDRTDVVATELSRLSIHMQSELLELVELDVAARRSAPSPKVLPDRIERLLVANLTLAICPVKVGAIKTTVVPQLLTEAIQKAKVDVAAFVREHQFVDLLKGHLVFGVLRLLFTRVASAIKGKKVIVDDDSMAQLLSDAVWKTPPSKAHKVLSSAVRKRVREVLPFYSS